MPAPIVVPFNFQPVNTGRSTTTYTVPAGRYSRVIINIGLTASSNLANATAASQAVAQGGSIGINSDTCSESIELWLKAGDVLSFTTTVASGSATWTLSSMSSGVMYTDSTSASSSATINLNAASLATFYATAQAVFSMVATSVGSATSGTYATFSGTSTVVITYAEFNVIS